MDRKPTKLFLDLPKQENSRSREQKFNLNHKKTGSGSLIHFLDLNWFIDPEPNG